MRTKRKDLSHITMDVLILRALALEPQYGWALSHRIHEVSGKKLLIQQGSLYPSLSRLESRGWIKGEWVWTENRHRVRHFEATEIGRQQIPKEDSWKKLAASIARIMKTP